MCNLILANSLGLSNMEKTAPVKVTSLFLSNLFDINLNFSSRMKFAFREGGTQRLKDHVTHSDLQLVFTLFRSCNAYGYIELINRKTLYRRLTEEYETPISEGQFYVSLEKFIRHNLILEEIGSDGSKHHRLNYFVDETNKIGHYVLFHPFVFTKQFNSLTLAEKKLIISAYAQTSGNTNKVITRNLKQKDGRFRHAQFSGLLNFLHKTQRSHVNALLHNLSEIRLPVESQKLDNLFTRIEMVSGKVGDKVELQFNPGFVLEVKQNDAQKYYKPLDACALYPKFFRVLQREADFYGVGEVLSDRQLANKLVKMLRSTGIRFIRYAFHQLRQYISEKGSFPRNPFFYIKDCIGNKYNAILDSVLRKTGAEAFITYPETNEDEVKERKWHFTKAVADSKLGLRTIRKRLEEAVHNLNKSYPLIPWELEDYGTDDSYQTRELRNYLNIDSIRKEALQLKVDPYYYSGLEYNAYLAIRQENPKAVEEWMRGELSTLPKLPGKRLIPFNFRLEKLIFDNNLTQLS